MASEKNWSELAKNFDELQDFVVGSATKNIVDNKLSELANLGKTIEFGCGNGRNTAILASRCTSLIASDISEDMIAVAKQKHPNLENVTFCTEDCYQTKYQADSFDTVFMGNLIHVVLEPARALAEAKRVLKPGGKIILLSYTGDQMTPEDLQKMFERYISKFGAPPENSKMMLLADLEKLVQNAQFKICESQLIGADTKAMFVIAEK